MDDHQQQELWNAVRLLAISLLLFVVVFFAPDAGDQNAKSFFAIAKGSVWGGFGNWPAAWCSVKIILLCLGTILFLNALGRFAEILKRETLSLVIAISALVPTLGLLLGCYYLVKAVL